ncbi:hypothetical protein COCMIDRAFT_93693 [Bipolaris oryzae ATCC 44560]|uniref:MARVEL domain-containing protein n=1 Tax=Bipolaris oryzae ATCC 44560 TaxID=930090 RepID=W6Z7X8_COCMI|nr:uncharacterized protein COCMIDRAFT_93693 [Bipolaris oryzae ATCC 44560]EUC46110.1 hypothetical protein COCMIDRAFT_93693 [Bipolaris oryzae ATCC 44560]
MVPSIFNVALRGVQALFGIIILGLSVTLIHGHHWGSLPAGLGYGAFVGGLSFVAAFIGLAATRFDSLGGMFGFVIDSVIALINLAGGVLYAFNLRGVDCKMRAEDPSNVEKMIDNEWLNGGCREYKFCWNGFKYGDESKAIAVYEGHCKEAKADSVFMFLTAIVMLVCALLVWLRMRRGY